MKKKLILSSVICVLVATIVGTSTAGITASASTQTYTVTADASTSTGAIMYGGMNGLYALGNNTQPADADISGLVNFQWSGQMAPGGTQHTNGDAFDTIDQAMRTGMKGIDIYLQDYYSTWPYTNPGIASYVSTVVKPEGTKVENSTYKNNFRFVLFNEPDWIWYGTSGTLLTNFENDWKTAYTALRSVDPTAVIIGPSFSAYNASAYDSFFSFCKNNNCLPNLTSWHELGSTGPTPINSDLASYRSIESKYGISQIPVYINEAGRETGEMARPGRMIQYLARFENDKISGAMAAWGQIGYMDDLIGTDGNPTGCWQLYRWYGQTKGNTISVSDSDSTGCNQVMAFHNGGNNVKVIFGGSLNDSDVYNASVVIKGLTGSSQSYTVYGCDYTTTAASAYTVTSGTATISGGTATISVSGLKGLSAYMVQMGS